MYCEYGGLKYKIKKKNNKYIITSRVSIVAQLSRQKSEIFIMN